MAITKDEKTTVDTTPVTAVVTSAPEPAAKKERVIYVGPSILKKGLVKGTVYIEGIPAHFDDLIKECLLLPTLFVRLSDITKALADVDKKGTALWVAAEQLKGVK